MHEIRSLVGSADDLARYLDDAITRGSASASLEHADEVAIGDARMVLRTYERYSMTGSNRVTLSVSILAVGTQMEVSLTTSGGSEALFFKINTFGEAAFMDKAIEALDRYV